MANLGADDAKSIKVLHVDDDISMLETSKEILVDMNNHFRIDHAYNIEEAYKKIKIRNYDLIISDYDMPQKSGLQLLRELRENNNEIPFILFTGKGKEDVAIEALNLGSDGYINKQGNPETVYRELSHLIQLSLERSRSKLQIAKDALALQTVEDAIITVDQDLIIGSWNKAAEEIIGYSQNEALGKRINDILAPLKLNVPIERISLVLEDKGRFYDEVSYIDKEGKTRYGELTIINHIDKSSKNLGYTIVCHDVTEKKQMEASIQEKLCMLESIAENTGVGFVTVSKNYKILYANRFVKNNCGEVEGKKCYVALHNSEKICDDCGTKKVFENGVEKDSHECFQKAFNGSRPYYVEIITTPLKDKNGNVIAAMEFIVDIAEKKRVEEALRKSEEKYRLLADSLPEIVFETDSTGKLVYVNEQGFELSGYTKLDLEKGLFAFDLFDQKDKQRGKENFRKVLSNIPSRNNEYTLVRKDGSTFPVLVSSAAIIMGNKTVGLRGLLIDITQRKKIEDAFRNNEEKFRTIAEKSPNMIFINYRGRVVYANKKCEDFMGYTRDEFYSPNFSFLSLCAPEYAELLKSKFAMHSRGEDVDPYEYVLLTRDGKRLNAIISSKLIDYEDGKAILGIVTDITQIKQTEQEIRISEEKYRSLFENASDVILTGDLAGKISSINVAVEKYGLKREQVIGRNIREFLSTEDSLRQDNVFQEIRSGKTLSNSVKVDTPLKKTIFEIKTDPLRINDRVVGFQTILRDVTEHRKYEMDLKISHDRLELMNEKLRVVGSLTRHDVSNKLSTVTGMSYLLKKKNSDQTDIVDGLEKIDHAVKESIKIFDFARIYEQLGVEELKYIDVENSINEAISLFSGLNIRVKNECHALSLFADSFLVHLFCNLIDNSRKHGKKTTTIRVYYEKSNSDELRLIYEDDGVGISVENKTKLFSEGFSTAGSSGFGLFLIKKMMGVYGWAIAESGEPGKGVKFVITIPNKSKTDELNYILQSNSLKC